VRRHKRDDDWVAQLVVVIAKKGVSDSQRTGLLDGSERQNRMVGSGFGIITPIEETKCADCWICSG